MAHASQQEFCQEVAETYPWFFNRVKVLDVGSMDINGNNRYLFENCEYTGMDLGPGPNVDVVCRATNHVGEYNTVISTEALEHDEQWYATIPYIVRRLLLPGGLYLFTCATTGREEHGVLHRHPTDSPYTNHYYRNVTEVMVRSVIDVDEHFSAYKFNVKGSDLQFWGIKKNV